MSDNYKLRSLIEIVNDVLSTVRDYYDSEYVYYIEKEQDDIETIYEWCAENVPWQRDRLKLLPPENQPKWMKQEITDTTSDSYSVFLRIDDETTAVLAAVGVHRGGCVQLIYSFASLYSDAHPSTNALTTASQLASV